jgi:hypothetical protein
MYPYSGGKIHVEVGLPLSYRFKSDVSENMSGIAPLQMVVLSPAGVLKVIPGFLLLLPQQSEKPGQGPLFIQMLGPFILGYGAEARGVVDGPDGGLGLIHMLAARA